MRGNFFISLSIMYKGMLSIFVVLGILAFIILLLSHFTNKKK